jgi:hypothetical protein
LEGFAVRGFDDFLATYCMMLTEMKEEMIARKDAEEHRLHAMQLKKYLVEAIGEVEDDRIEEVKTLLKEMTI